MQSDLQQEQMVEPAFFDIYLCDDCDAELYSFDAYVVSNYSISHRKSPGPSLIISHMTYIFAKKL